MIGQLREWFVYFPHWGLVIGIFITIFVLLMAFGVIENTPADPGTPLDPDRAAP